MLVSAKLPVGAPVILKCTGRQPVTLNFTALNEVNPSGTLMNESVPPVSLVRSGRSESYHVMALLFRTSAGATSTPKYRSAGVRPNVAILSPTLVRPFAAGVALSGRYWATAGFFCCQTAHRRAMLQ